MAPPKQKAPAEREEAWRRHDASREFEDDDRWLDPNMKYVDDEDFAHMKIALTIEAAKRKAFVFAAKSPAKPILKPTAPKWSFRTTVPPPPKPIQRPIIQSMGGPVKLTKLAIVETQDRVDEAIRNVESQGDQKQVTGVAWDYGEDEGQDEGEDEWQKILRSMKAQAACDRHCFPGNGKL